MPRQFHPTNIGPGYVVGIWWDEDLAEYLRLPPLLKP
jgi:hypothetical protein